MSSGQTKEALELLNSTSACTPKAGMRMIVWQKAMKSWAISTLATENYKRSLALNPDNKNAVGHLDKLAKAGK